jgi:LysM repeat protein
MSIVTVIPLLVKDMSPTVSLLLIRKITGLVLIVGWSLAGCGRVITPVPEAAATPTSMAIVQRTRPTLTPRATSTPRLATPVATPTPTKTPTPVIYTIQPGDTLLKIAIEFGRSNEAIQEANGIIDPRYLQIGQPLIIPPPEVNPEEPPTPTPTPLPLNVTAINFQQTRQGTLWCLGAIYNPGSVPLTEVVLEASLMDESGALLAREAAFTQLDVVLPEQSVPFAILFNTPPSSFAQYQITPVSGIPLAEDTRYYFDLEAFDVRGSLQSTGAYQVTGQLHNFGGADVEVVRLVVIAFDTEGRALAQRQVELALSLLKAGAITPFEVELTIPNGKVDRHAVLAQGLKTE